MAVRTVTAADVLLKKRESIVTGLKYLFVGTGKNCVPQNVCSSGHDLLAPATFPDSGSLSLHGILSAEIAIVLGVLRNLHPLEDLSEGGTISGAVFTADTSLLCVLSLKKYQQIVVISTRIDW